MQTEAGQIQTKSNVPVFIHQSTELLGQYTRKIAGKGAFLKTDFCLNLWLDWGCYRGWKR